MPRGENSKAVEAKARKSNALKAEQERKQKAAEDASWADDDKQIAKKQNRKDEKAKKRLETINRKTTNKLLADEELTSLASSSSKSQSAAKVTQAEIAMEREKREAAARKSTAASSSSTSFSVIKVTPLHENLNRLSQPDEEVKTVNEALKMFSLDEKGQGALSDRHPERRQKAAYSAFEETHLPQLKLENPSLRLTQLKQMLFMEWQKSPENPTNQERLSYNAKN